MGQGISTRRRTGARNRSLEDLEGHEGGSAVAAGSIPRGPGTAPPGNPGALDVFKALAIVRSTSTLVKTTSVAPFEPSRAGRPGSQQARPGTPVAVGGQRGRGAELAGVESKVFAATMAICI